MRGSRNWLGLAFPALALLVGLGAPSLARERPAIKTTRPVFAGKLQVTVHFQGAQAGVLVQDVPGVVELLAPEDARLVHLHLEPEGTSSFPVRPTVLTREFKLRKRSTVSGGVVLQDEVREYVDRQTFEWTGLPPGQAALTVEGHPGGWRLELPAVEVSR